MTSGENVHCVKLEADSRLLRSRERSLRHIAQSPLSSTRPLAEQELGKVRSELAEIYAKMRQLRPNA